MKNNNNNITNIISDWIMLILILWTSSCYNMETAKFSFISADRIPSVMSLNLPTILEKVICYVLNLGPSLFHWIITILFIISFIILGLKNGIKKQPYYLIGPAFICIAQEVVSICESNEAMSLITDIFTVWPYSTLENLLSGNSLYFDFPTLFLLISILSFFIGISCKRFANKI